MKSSDRKEKREPRRPAPSGRPSPSQRIGDGIEAKEAEFRAREASVPEASGASGRILGLKQEAMEERRPADMDGTNERGSPGRKIMEERLGGWTSVMKLGGGLLLAFAVVTAQVKISPVQKSSIYLI